jgi:hypothetical protein
MVRVTRRSSCLIGNRRRENRKPPIPRQVLYGASELRAGWRLLIFLAIVVGLIKGSSLLIGLFLRGAGDDALFLVREVIDFLIFLFASWLMGRIESRTIIQYGLPWRGMFGAQFWHGALLGLASISGLLLAMRLVGVFHFGRVALHGADIWKWGIVHALVFILVSLR